MCEEIEKIIMPKEYKSIDLPFKLSHAKDTNDDSMLSPSFGDLVNYINGSQALNKDKFSVNQPEIHQELDVEIGEFERRLAKLESFELRQSPCCSAEFLNVLRHKYLEVRKKLLSN